jgi:hypothetical protein
MSHSRSLNPERTFSRGQGRLPGDATCSAPLSTFRILKKELDLHTATARFIATIAVLPPETLAAAFDHAVGLRRQGGREASRALRLSASENSELDHAVRSALLPRSEELNLYRPGLHSDAKSVCLIAARAVRKPATLSAAQYALLTAPFTAVGVDVPGATPTD